jgi:NADPH-dependent ferric siderophore reductase
MPELHPFLAQRAERWFGLASTVTAIEALSPTIRQVRFSGSSLQDRPWLPSHEVEFRVDDRALRHYTPARYDTASGVLDVLFYLHGRGPGSLWAAELQIGQTVLVMGPGNGGMSLQSADWHLFLGDESTLGVLHAMTSALH